MTTLHTGWHAARFSSRCYRRSRWQWVVIFSRLPRYHNRSLPGAFRALRLKLLLIARTIMCKHTHTSGKHAKRRRRRPISTKEWLGEDLVERLYFWMFQSAAARCDLLGLKYASLSWGQMFEEPVFCVWSTWRMFHCSVFTLEHAVGPPQYHLRKQQLFDVNICPTVAYTCEFKLLWCPQFICIKCHTH